MIDNEEGMDIPEFLRRQKGEVNKSEPAQPVVEKPQQNEWMSHGDGEQYRTQELSHFEKIQRGKRENAGELMAEINGHHDDFIQHGKMFDAYEFFRSREAKPAIVTIVLEKLQPSLDELKAIKTDPEMMFASTLDVNANIKFLSAIIADGQRWMGNVPRKTRTVKIVPAKKVKALKFKKEDRDLKLVSIQPEKIIGAYELFVYNTKDRKLTRYVARTRDGLMVKGGSITEFDKDNSEVRMLRKPAEVLPKVLEKKKKIMEGLTTKGSVPSGRITTDMILLRVG